MDSNRRTAVIAGVLFIVATVAAVSQFPLLGSLAATDYLTEISANATQVVAAAFLELIMVAAIFAIPVVLFPILRKQHENTARAYLAARILEGVLLVVPVVSLLLLVTLSRESVAGATDGPHYQTLGALLRAASDWTVVIGGQVVLSLTALILNYSLCRSRLIPRLISIWGLVGVPLMLAGGVLVVFGVLGDSSTIQTALMLPLAVQEMVFAVWLIVKGFNPSALASE